ncbi:hypothetical protein ALC56_14706 [Trachymyrmex septentrionalis]|uniref:Uncharacterized protein n=1 Tax=Trachymyrmex septentrionalis TaxID=34720 RepID=A0A195ESN4_9HYME|nr:hypothetical protein ALC56_14706 [Trachymyrmex septentrionalis]
MVSAGDLRSSCRFENFPYTFLAFGRTLKVGESIDFFRHGPTLLRLNWLLFHLAELLDGIRIIAQVFFVSNKDNGHVWAEVLHLRCPLLGNVLQGIGTIDGEAH